MSASCYSSGKWEAGSRSGLPHNNGGVAPMDKLGDIKGELFLMVLQILFYPIMLMMRFFRPAA